MTLTTKTGKGAKLTPAELDANWTEIETRLASLESGGTEGVGIASLSVINNNQLMVTLTDNSTRGPFTLPTGKYAFKAEWQAAFNYIANDIISFEGSLYLVAYPHTSAATFDPGVGDNNGHYYYTLIMQGVYSGQWQGAFTYAETYRAGDMFKFEALSGAVTVYRVNVTHETAAPFDANRQINSAAAYTAMFTVPAAGSGGGGSSTPSEVYLQGNSGTITSAQAGNFVEQFIMPKSLTYKTDFEGCYAYYPNGNAEIVFDIMNLETVTKIGTITFAANDTVGTFAQEVAPSAISAGGRLGIRAPVSGLPSSSGPLVLTITMTA